MWIARRHLRGISSKDEVKCIQGQRDLKKEAVPLQLVHGGTRGCLADEKLLLFKCKACCRNILISGKRALEVKKKKGLSKHPTLSLGMV